MHSRCFGRRAVFSETRTIFYEPPLHFADIFSSGLVAAVDLLEPSMTKSPSSLKARGGWRGRWSLDSQVTCHQLVSVTHCIATCHRVTIPHGVFVKSRQKQPQQPQLVSIPRVPCFFVALFTIDPSGQPMSAAQRRKQPRLRSWWRHEQQSIARPMSRRLLLTSRYEEPCGGPQERFPQRRRRLCPSEISRRSYLCLGQSGSSTPWCLSR